MSPPACSRVGTARSGPSPHGRGRGGSGPSSRGGVAVRGAAVAGVPSAVRVLASCDCEVVSLASRPSARCPLVGVRPLWGVPVGTERGSMGVRALGTERLGLGVFARRCNKSPRSDSNPRPSDPQPSILTTRTRARLSWFRTSSVPCRSECDGSQQRRDVSHRSAPVGAGCAGEIA